MFNVKKFSLSVAFIVAFFGYVFRNHFSDEERLRPVGNPPSTPTATALPSELPVRGGTSAGLEQLAPSSTPVPTVVATPVPTPMSRGNYRDGSYTGPAADAVYGLIQVKAIVQGGKLTDVQFLQYPNDRGTSIEINTQAMPLLKQEAIAAQSGNVDIVSGATDSSIAFQKSLTTALRAAQ